MKPLGLHPSARRELAQAICYYNDQEPGLGDQFLTEVQGALARLRTLPLAEAAVEGGARRVLVARFHYSIIYVDKGKAIIVMAIMHQRQRPGYWLRRRI
jgi:plasmid stabilization system protein ParE